MNKRFITFIGAILAGIAIGIGGTIYLTVANKVVGAILFSVGLYTICVHKLNLFTGKIGYCLDQPKSYLIDLLIIWFGNFMGTCFTASLIWLTRIGKLIQQNAYNVCQVKLEDNVISLFFLGVFCGILMYSAVEGYRRTHNPLLLFACVSVFILCGFEHCVADMFYFAAAVCWNFKAIAAIIVITLGNSIGAILMSSYKRCLDD